MTHTQRFRTLAVLPSLLGAAPLSAQDAPYEAIPFARDVMVPMRDGVKVATDLYRPAIRGTPVADKLPVLLQRTPYGKEDPGLVERAMYFVRHGYVVALQDLRGRYESEGGFQKYDDVTAPDGYDTVEWLARLPYTDGQVGMWGTSYGAHTQADAAKMAPPHLTRRPRPRSRTSPSRSGSRPRRCAGASVPWRWRRTSRTTSSKR